MKKLLFVSMLVTLFGTSCYKKEIAPESPVITLTNTRWVIDKHVPVKAGTECSIAAEIVLNDDSTGYYYYPTKCSADDVDTLRFNWTLSVDGKNLYYTNINGDPKQRMTVGISDYRYDALELRSGTYKKRFLDGIFVSIGPR